MCCSRHTARAIGREPFHRLGRCAAAGRAEAVHGVSLLKEAGSRGFHSMLRRAITTGQLAVSTPPPRRPPLDPGRAQSVLNERHSWRAQGTSRPGDENMARAWRWPSRRSLRLGSAPRRRTRARYAGEPIPATECLKGRASCSLRHDHPLRSPVRSFSAHRQLHRWKARALLSAP